MGFISFNETYYRRRLEDLENKPLTEEDIYEARQLLKVLDDLTDEGYTNLNDQMERDFSCLTRLRALLKRAGAAPFLQPHEDLAAASYTLEEYELSFLLEEMMAGAKKEKPASENPFLKDIYGYCQWIGFDEDTAYIFLLRDTLLPYVYFKSRYGKNVYPWLVSRRFLEDITGIEFADDDIRLPLYEALETGRVAFEDFSGFCREGILDALDRYPKLKEILLGLLSSVKERKIVVVESGYMGTIPMLLKALDDRVNFRLYTTAPFLYETYDNNIFCRRYEDIRKFETVCSQDRLIRYSSYRDGKFYVNVAGDIEVQRKSLGEINAFLR